MSSPLDEIQLFDRLNAAQYEALGIVHLDLRAALDGLKNVGRLGPVPPRVAGDLEHLHLSIAQWVMLLEALLADQGPR